jgi:hypothetical protein
MPIERKPSGWRSFAAVALILCVFIAGCSRMEPFQPRNHREEGPERGVFSGPRGEFVIPLPGEPAREEPAPEKASEE